jgi:hypothetical protein
MTCLFLTGGLFLLSIAGLNAASTYFVSTAGDDSHSGTSPDYSFRTIGRAAASMEPGDECRILPGVYRETVELNRSGVKGRPITFRAEGDEPVVVDGSELVPGPWTEGEDGVWRARVEGSLPVEAVFFDGTMLVEARWPDFQWKDNWDPGLKWALTDEGTSLGHIKSEKLAEAGIDLSGGLLYIKLSKGNSCFTRPVVGHKPGTADFYYNTDGVVGRAWREDAMPQRIKRHGLAGNRFFVVARGALNAPGEWWHDVERGEILVIPPEGSAMEGTPVAVKRRRAGIVGAGISDVIIDGLSFFACNVRFENASRVTLRHLDFLYPSTPRIFPDRDSFQALHAPIRIHGTRNVIEHSRIRWAIDGGLHVEGVGNRVENCVVHDVNLHGRHPGPAITMQARQDQFPDLDEPNIVRNNTVYNVGSVGIYPLGRGVVNVSHNHIFNAGLHGVDISALYIPVGRHLGGSRLHHNWLHDVNGIGFRVDVQGRDITFDHNLVWNAAAGGKLQGVQLRGFNNTVVVDNPAHPIMAVFEPDAAPEDLERWRIRNNVAYSYVDRKSLRGGYDDGDDDDRAFRRPLDPIEGRIDHNATIIAGRESDFFVDPERFDFRPRVGGPLDGKGITITGIAERSDGRPPSIGALEPDKPVWPAGADWLPDGLPIPSTPEEASRLARECRPASHPVGAIDLRYRAQ